MRKKRLGKAQLRKRRNIISFKNKCREIRSVEGGDPEWGVPFRRWGSHIITVFTGEYTKVRKKPKTKKIEILLPKGLFKPVENLRDFMLRVNGNKVARAH